MQYYSQRKKVRGDQRVSQSSDSGVLYCIEKARASRKQLQHSSTLHRKTPVDGPTRVVSTTSRTEAEAQRTEYPRLEMAMQWQDDASPKSLDSKQSGTACNWAVVVVAVFIPSLWNSQWRGMFLILHS